MRPALLQIYWDHSNTSLLRRGGVDHDRDILNYCQAGTDRPAGQPDHVNYLVRPVTAKGKLRRTKEATTQAFGASLDFEIASILLQLTNSQLRDIVEIQATVAHHRSTVASNGARYERIKWWRPRRRIAAFTPGFQHNESNGICRRWWYYVGLAVMDRRHQQQGFAINPDRLMRRRKCRLEYTALWVQYRTQSAFPNEALASLKMLEEVMSHFEIQMFRTMADAHIARDPELHAQATKLREESSAAKPANSWGEWLTKTYISRSGGAMSATSSNAGAHVSGDSLRQVEEGGISDIAATCTVLAGSCVLIDDRRDGLPIPVVELKFLALRLGFEHEPAHSSFTLDFGLGDLTIQDLLHTKSNFPVLVGPKGSSQAPAQQSRRDNSDVFNQNLAIGSSDLLFRATIVSNPERIQADYKIVVYSRPLEIVYHASVAAALTSYFSNMPTAARASTTVPAPPTEADLNVTLPSQQFFEENVGPGAGNAREMPMIELDMDIYAPELVIPESLVQQDCRSVVVNLGRLKVRRKCDPRRKAPAAQAALPDDDDDDDDEFITPPSTPPSDAEELAASENPADLARLAAAAEALTASADNEYDAFDISLTDVQVLALEPYSKRHLLSAEAEHNASILERLSLTCHLQCLAVAQRKDLALTKLESILPTLRLDLSETKLLCLMACIKADDDIAPDDASSTASAIDDPLSSPEPQLANVSMIERVVPNASTIKEMEAVFTIGEVQVQINAGNPHAVPLVKICVVGVESSMVREMHEENFCFVVNELLIIDQLVPEGSPFTKMVSTSEGTDGAFLQLNYTRNTGPASAAGGDAAVPHLLELCLDTAEVNVNQFTYAALLDFVDGALPHDPSEDAQLNPAHALHAIDQQTFQAVSTFAEVNITLVENLRGFAKISIMGGSAKINSLTSCTKFTGNLGRVTISDLTTAGALYRNCFTTSGDEVLSFEFIKYNDLAGRSNISGSQRQGVRERHFQNEFTMKMASIKLVYTHRFWAKLKQYISQFQELQEFMYLARKTAQEFIELEDSAAYTKLTISIDRPVLTIPQNSFSNNILVANLGCMSVSNYLEPAPPVPEYLVTSGVIPESESQSEINSIKVEVQNMNLYSTTRQRPCSSAGRPNDTSEPGVGVGPRSSADAGSVSADGGIKGEGAVSEVRRHQLVDNCTLHVQLDMCLDSRRRDLPGTNIVGRVSDVDIRCTHEQYGIILMVLNENFACENSMNFNQSSSPPPSPTRRSRSKETDDPVDRGQRATLIELENALRSANSIGEKKASIVAATDAPSDHGGGSEDDELTKWVTFDASCTFMNVTLELFADGWHTAAGEWVEPEPLARLDLLDTALSYTSFSNGLPDGNSSTVTVFSKAIRMHDTQITSMGSKNVFTEVLKPIGSAASGVIDAPPLLQVTYRSSATAQNIYVILNQTRVVVALPWVKRMWDWMFDMPQSEVWKQWQVDMKYAESSSSPMLQEQEGDHNLDTPRTMKLKLSITDPEFVVVENRHRQDTHAVVLKFCAVLSYMSVPRNCPLDITTVDTKYAHIPDCDRTYLESVFEGVEVYSCKLNQEHTTALSIVDPCIVQVEMSSRQPGDSKVSEIQFSVEINSSRQMPVYTRFSYRDFKLFVTIMKSLASTAEDPPPTGETDEEETPHAPFLRYRKKLAALTDMGFHLVYAVRALSYFSGSQERAAIWLCRTNLPVPGSQQETESGSNHATVSRSSIDLFATMNTTAPGAAPLPLGRTLLQSATALNAWGAALAQPVPSQSPEPVRVVNLKLLARCGYAEQDCEFALQAAQGNLQDAAIWLLVNAPPVLRASSSFVIPQAHDGASTTSLSEASPYRQTLQIDFRSQNIQLCIIDDCAGKDQPLVEMKAESLTLTGTHSSDGKTTLSEANFGGILSCEYFNCALSAWEPCVEPWAVLINARAQQGEKNVARVVFKSKAKLELNLTPTLVQSITTAASAWSDDFQNVDASTERTRFVPYCIRNRTGLPLTFWTTSAIGARSKAYPVDSGDRQNFDFTHGQEKLRHMASQNRTVRKIALKVQGWQEVQPLVTVDRVGTFVFYITPEASSYRPVRLIIAITVKLGVKLISVQSALVIKSCLNIALDMQLEYKDDRPPKPLPPLQPDATFYVPLHEIDAAVNFRPHNWDYSWSTPSVMWNRPTAPTASVNITSRIMGTSPTAGLERRFRVCAEIMKLPYNPTLTPCPANTITLYPPILLENLLPSKLEFVIVGSSVGGELYPGKSQLLHDVALDERINVTFKLPNFDWNEPIALSELLLQGSADLPVKFVDSQGRALVLRLYSERLRGCSGARRVVLYASYWMVNKTGLPLCYRQSGRSATAAGQTNNIVALCAPDPLLFSCDDETISSGNRCRVRVGNSVWGEKIEMDVVGITMAIQIKEPASGQKYAKIYNLGVEVSRGHGRFHRTKIIAFLPNFIFMNASDHQLHIQVAGSNKPMQMGPRTTRPFYWPRADGKKHISVRFQNEESNWGWSTNFNLSKVGTFHTKLPNTFDSRVWLIRIEIRVAGAAYQVIFTDADNMPPFRIRNNSDVTITYHQDGVSMVSEVHPKSTTPYAWDDLNKDQTMVLCVKDVPYSTAQHYDLRRIYKGPRLLYPQYFCIIGPSGLVLGGVVDSKQPDRPVELRLCARQPRDPMQLWQASRGGRLRNKAGFVLEIVSGDISLEFKVQLRQIGNGAGAPDTQRWRYENGQFVSMASKSTNRMVLEGMYDHTTRDAQVNDGFRVVATDVSTTQNHFTKHYIPPGSGALTVRILADGPTRVIAIDDSEAISTLPPVPAALDGNDLDEGIPGPASQPLSPTTAAASATTDGWDVEAEVEMPAGVGISVIDYEELIYVSSDRIAVIFSSTAAAHSLDVKVAKVQIDNQLQHESHLSNLLTPSPRLSREAAPETDVLHFSLVRSRDSSDNTTVFRHLELAVSPLSLKIHERVLLRLAHLGHTIKMVATASRDDAGDADDLASSLRRQVDAQMTEVLENSTFVTYFELLRLNKMEITASVQTCADLEPELKQVKRRLGLGALVRFEDAVIHMRDFVLERPFANLDTLFELIQTHYTQEILRQAYMIVGSVDFLGNPIGILNNVGRGIEAFVSETSTGNVFGGAGSFVQHVTHGLADSVSKLSGSISTNLGRATMDRTYQADRERRKSAAKDTSGHLASAVTSLGRGIVHGVTGVVTQPVKGMQERGIEGLVTGGMKGLVGFVAKPVAGVFDLFSETTAAVRHSASHSKTRVERVRLPRHIGPDRVLRPYNQDDARGQQLMLRLNNRNTSERFVYHTQLGIQESEAFITSERIIFLGAVASGNTGVTAEIWFSGLYSYKVVRQRKSISLNFIVSQEVPPPPLPTTDGCRPELGAYVHWGWCSGYPPLPSPPLMDVGQS